MEAFLLGLGVLLTAAGAAVCLRALRTMRRGRRGAVESPAGPTAGSTAAPPAGASAATPGEEGPWVVPCTSCKRSLRIPRHRGVLKVSCPGCGARFIFDSELGAAQ
jgi:hypothetical protein